MRIVTVDDEPRAGRLLGIMLSEIDGIEVCASFENSKNALEYLNEHSIDAVFLDVEMPGMNGVELATELLKLPIIPAIVFVTAYPKYSMAAWDIGAADYVVKPYVQEDIAKAVMRAEKLKPIKKTLPIKANCFPAFSLYIDNIPVPFRSKKSKELLAYLVHNRGAWVDTGKAVAVLFEDDDFVKSRRYYNTLVYRLRKQLLELGVDNFLETEYGKCRVNSNAFSCDYYEYLKGNKECFKGAYLEDYSWAEPTLAEMLWGTAIDYMGNER